MYRQLLKPLLLYLVLALVCSRSFGQTAYYTTLKSQHIKGDVDSIVQNQYLVFNNDSIDAPINSTVVSLFNRKGFVLEDRNYSYENDLDHYRRVRTKASKILSSYNDKGILSGKLGYDSNGDLNSKDVYMANPSNNVLELKHYYIPTQSLITITKLRLDKRGNIIDASIYDPYGKLEYKHKYKYDGDNNCIEHINIKTETLKEYKTIFTYHNGNLVKEIYYNDLGEIQSTYIYKYAQYDSKNNWTLQKVYLNGRFCRIEERIIAYK